MDPSQHPSTADWAETKHKSWGTTIVDLRTNIVELFTTLHVQQAVRKLHQQRYADRF